MNKQQTENYNSSYKKPEKLSGGHSFIPTSYILIDPYYFLIDKIWKDKIKKKTEMSRYEQILWQQHLYTSSSF